MSWNDEKVAKLQEMLPDDMLTKEDILELFSMLDNTFSTMEQNLSQYPTEGFPSKKNRIYKKSDVQ